MDFEDVYHELMDDSIYEKWLEIIQEELQGQQILDLACGTGALSLALAQAGFQVQGLDLSADMLTRADQQQEAAGIKFPLIQGDMQDLTGLPSYDGVVCSLDALCYLEGKEQVNKVFQQVYDHLTSQGIFFFDVHSLYQMESIYPGFSYHYSGEDFAFLWEAWPTEVAYTIDHEMELFTREGSAYQRKFRTIREKTYPLQDYLSMLEAGGFSNVEIFTDYPSPVLNPEASRWFFVCRK